MKLDKQRRSRVGRTKDPAIRPSTRGLMLHTARSVPAALPRTAEPPPSRRVPGQIDPGIRQAVERLQARGIETFESCEGGPGHAYPEPTVAFYGTPEAGWRAVAACLAYGLPVLSLRRVWDVVDANEPTGATLGGYIQASNGLAKFDALITARFVTGPALSVLGFDSFSVWTVIVVVMNVAMLGRIF